MKAPALRHVGPAPVPGLAEVLADPALLGHLSADVLVDLRRQLRRMEADVVAAIERHVVQLSRQPALAEVLGVEAAARQLRTSADSLYRKHKLLRLGYIDPLDGRLKFTAEEIAEYIQRQGRG